MNALKVYHYYGRTTLSMGLPESEFVEVNSRSSHSWNECLKRLHEEHGMDCRIYLHTLQANTKRVNQRGIEWVFVPVSLRALYRSKAFIKIANHPDLWCSFPLLQELRQYPPDLFVFYGCLPNLFTLVLATHLKQRGIPFVTIVHAEVSNLLRRSWKHSPFQDFLSFILSRFRRQVYYRLFKAAAAVVVLTEEDSKAMARTFSVEQQKVRVIPSGVNDAYFYPAMEKPSLSEPSLCFVGRLEEAKGFLEALKVFHLIKKRFPRAILHVAGVYTSSEYKAKAEAFIETNELTGSIIFHGYIGPEELGELYRGCHLLLFPSRQEGLPRAVLESMACGTPAIVLSGTGGHSRLISNGINGIVTDRQKMADEAIRLLEDEHQLRRLSLNAARLIQAEFSFATMYERVKRLYGELLRSS
jgi:glycosyltransferase involved in cell wall biosynthesis